MRIGILILRTIELRKALSIEKTKENQVHRGRNVKLVFLPSSTESRRGHATMKTNQISNAHASYGKTTSVRPSSSPRVGSGEGRVWWSN